MQTLLVIIILACCVGYTVRRLWLRLNTPADEDVRCEGCPLAETCTHKHQPHEHQHHRNGQDCPGGTACHCCH